MLNYDSSAIATRVETFNRSEKKTAIVLWCSTDRGHAGIGFQASGLLSVGRDRLMPKPPRQSEKAIIPKVQAGLRIHALAQVYQSLVESVDSNQTEARVLDIQYDIHSGRHDQRKAKHMEPTAHLAAGHAVAR